MKKPSLLEMALGVVKIVSNAKSKDDKLRNWLLLGSTFTKVRNTNISIK